MSDERAQGRGWVRIPASRAEQPGTTRAAPPQPSGQSSYPQYPQDLYPQDSYPQSPHPQSSYPQDSYPQSPYAQDAYPQDPYPHAQHPHGRPAQDRYPQVPYDPSMIYLSLVKRWQEAGRTLPGHPDEEWERLISQPCWPGR